MSRLDSFIRRLEAQRACLNHAIHLVDDLPGPVFELGLGNGRTFDHLRANLPDREIFVFERQVAAHPECVPDDMHLFEGPIEDTLDGVAKRFAGQIALLHADLGSGRPEIDRKTSVFLAGRLPIFMKSGGIILSDQPLPYEEGEIIPLPEQIQPGRYDFYRAP